MASKYIDTTAMMQIIGCVYNTPQILDFTDKYTIVDEDFPDEFIKCMNSVQRRSHLKIYQIFYPVDRKVRQYLNSKRVKSGY